MEKPLARNPYMFQITHALRGWRQIGLRVSIVDGVFESLEYLYSVPIHVFIDISTWYIPGV